MPFSHRLECRPRMPVSMRTSRSATLAWLRAPRILRVEEGWLWIYCRDSSRSQLPPSPHVQNYAPHAVDATNIFYGPPFGFGVTYAAREFNHTAHALQADGHTSEW